MINKLWLRVLLTSYESFNTMSINNDQPLAIIDDFSEQYFINSST